MLYLLGPTAREVDTSAGLAPTLLELKPSGGGVEIEDSLASIFNRVARLSGGPHHILIASDFQSHDWTGLSADSLQRLQELRQSLAMPPSLSLLPVGPKAGDPTDVPANIVVESLDLIPDRWTIGQQCEFLATIRNDSDQAISECFLELSVGDQIIHRSSVQLPPAATTQFSHSFNIDATVLPAAFASTEESPATEAEGDNNDSAEASD